MDFFVIQSGTCSLGNIWKFSTRLLILHLCLNLFNQTLNTYAPYTVERPPVTDSWVFCCLLILLTLQHVVNVWTIYCLLQDRNAVLREKGQIEGVKEIWREIPCRILWPVQRLALGPFMLTASGPWNDLWFRGFCRECGLGTYTRNFVAFLKI